MILANLFCAATAVFFLYTWYCMQTKVVRLERSRAPWPSVWPKLSVIVPIRNEERNLEQALRSLLEETYPTLEIVAVNDRSEDGSAKILEELRKKHPQLTVKTIETLPPGWLGKNHALHVGYKASQGEIVLFTDADVVYRPGTLQKAVALMLDGKWDHICALIHMESSSPVMRCVESFFGFFLILIIQPWRISDSKTENSLGIGAFNLIRKSVLDKIRGFEKFKMFPDDDIHLGRVIKSSGHRQLAIGGVHDISVEWYPSLRVCVRAFEKNMFAGLDFSWIKLISASVAGIALHIVPSVVPWFSTGVWQIVGFVSLGAIYLSIAVLFWLARSPLWAVPFYVPTAVLLMCIFWRTAILNTWRGGLHWRGTFYSMEELRKSRKEAK